MESAAGFRMGLRVFELASGRERRVSYTAARVLGDPYSLYSQKFEYINYRTVEFIYYGGGNTHNTTIMARLTHLGNDWI